MCRRCTDSRWPDQPWQPGWFRSPGVRPSEEEQGGGLIHALSHEPQSTRAWTPVRWARSGSAAASTNSPRTAFASCMTGDPGSRANIDHLAVTPAGVYVIAAKKYRERPHLRIEGGLLRPRVEKLVDGALKQFDIVRGAIGIRSQRRACSASSKPTGHFSEAPSPRATSTSCGPRSCARCCAPAAGQTSRFETMCIEGWRRPYLQPDQVWACVEGQRSDAFRKGDLGVHRPSGPAGAAVSLSLGLP